MKKLYFFLFSIGSAFSLQTQAATWTVNVKDDFYENPNPFNPVVGDSVVWIWMGTNFHTVTSSSVPSGAAALSSPSQSAGTYSYKITTAGAYVYNCTVHGVSMSSNFTATSNPGTGIMKLNPGVVSSAFPNPFVNRITISTTNADQVTIYNSMGQQIQTARVSEFNANTDFEITGSPSGLYYYATFKQGVILEKRPIVRIQ